MGRAPLFHSGIALNAQIIEKCQSKSHSNDFFAHYPVYYGRGDVSFATLKDPVNGIISYNTPVKHQVGRGDRSLLELALQKVTISEAVFREEGCVIYHLGVGTCLKYRVWDLEKKK